MAISQSINQFMTRKQIAAAARILIWYRSESALKQSILKQRVLAEFDVNSRSRSFMVKVYRGDLFFIVVESLFETKHVCRCIRPIASGVETQNEVEMDF